MLVKVLLADDLELESSSLQGHAILVCVLGGLAGRIVANDGVEASHQHETRLSQHYYLHRHRVNSPLGQDRANALLIGVKSCNEVLLKACHGVCKEARAVEKVADHDRLEDIELEVTL